MDQEKSPRLRGGRLPLSVAALVLAAGVGLLGYSLGRQSPEVSPPPADTSAEAGFARDMQVHHDQGVELAMIIRDRTDDPEVRLLGYDVATTQAQQSGQLYGWLTEWGLAQAGSEPPMAWMSRPASSASSESTTMHSMPMSARDVPAGQKSNEQMPGLATPAQIAELSAASGIEAERIFLTLMIAHHSGAVDMAEAVLDRAQNSSVRAFATAVVKSQTAEMEAMRSMLAERSSRSPTQ